VVKKIFVLILIGSLGANFFSIYILEKALFYRKNLTHIEKKFPNQGLHIRSVKQISDSGFDKVAAFIGGSFVKFWFFPDDLPLKISNQGGLEDKISQDYGKMQNDIIGSGTDYVFINSGFCEIHTAINSERNVDEVIDKNFAMLKKIIFLAQNDNITPVLTTLTPVRPVFLFPYSRSFSIGSVYKDRENNAIEAYNFKIKKYAVDNNLYLIDFHNAVKDKHGILKKEFSITDGEHLDIGAYNYLNSFLRKEIKKIINKK